MSPADLHAALVAYVVARCDALTVEVVAEGIDAAALVADHARFDGDPCATHPTLRLELVVGGATTQRLTVRPSLRGEVRAPVAAVDHAVGDPLRWTWGAAPLGDPIVAPPAGEAARPLLAGQPLRPGSVRPAQVAAGTPVDIVVRRGDLTLSVAGTLLGDAAVGAPARVRNEHTRAALSGRLVAPDRVEIP